MLAHGESFVAVDWNGTVVPCFGAPPYPAALAVLARLRDAGAALYVISRAPQAVVAADVARVGLAVDGVIGCTDKAPPLSDLRASLGPGLLIGDTAADRAAAQEAGVAFLQARLEGEPPLAGGPDSFTAWEEAAARLLAAPGAQG